jgi:DNA-binding LytR/AlgR family response regulator
MEPIRSVIIDDEPNAVRLLREILSLNDKINLITTFTDPALAVDRILEIRPELIFLDIQMGHMTGFDLLKAVSEKGFKPAIIFVTAYDQFAIEAMRHAAVDYLLKPVGLDDLNQSIERYLVRRKNPPVQDSIQKLLELINRERKMRFNTRTGFVLLDPREIVYCEADGNYTNIYCDNGFKETVSSNLRTIEESLKADNFTRISRAYLINQHAIRKIDRKSRTVVLDVAGRITTLHYSADRYRILSWLFGGEKE